MELLPRETQPRAAPLQVSYTAFLAVIWAGVALPGLILACRLLSRFRGPGRLFWDDALIILAWVLVLITAALWSWVAQDMYYTFEVQAGQADWAPDFPERMSRWLRVSLVVELFFYTALLAIKLSFLLFFRKLGDGVHNFRYIWWPVLFITAGAYFGSVGDVSYKCLVGSAEDIAGICTTGAEIRWTARTLQANCTLDVATDLLIMSLPAILLWGTRVRWSRKAAIIGLFSLTVVTIIVAIVRTVMVSTAKGADGNFDVSWLWLWSAVEPSVAIIVCGLSAFPQLFAQSSRNKKPVFTPSETQLRLMSRIRAKKMQKRPEDSLLNLTINSQRVNTVHPNVDIERDCERAMTHENPVLVPDSQQPVTRAYRGEIQPETGRPIDQIQQQVEFSMTEHRS